MFSPLTDSFQPAGEIIPTTTATEPLSSDDLWREYLGQDYEDGDISQSGLLTLLLESAP